MKTGMATAGISIPLSCPSFCGNEQAYLRDCLDSGWISARGEYVDRFEAAFALSVNAQAAVACTSGTTALHTAMLLAGVQPGEEVIVPTLTFIAPVNVVRYVKAEPVFMDCDDYLNLDVAKLARFLQEECHLTDQGAVNRATGRRIRAVIPVHIFGSMCDMEPLLALAAKYRLVVVEDATEALGSRMRTGALAGNCAGTLGDFGCYSFNGNKIVTCGGGGMIVARDQRALAKAKYLTTQARDDDMLSVHNEVGYNYRLTAIQAAMGLAQLEHLPGFIATKKMRYAQYQQCIGKIPGLSLLRAPSYCDSNCWFYSLMINEQEYGLGRGALLSRFAAECTEVRPLWKLNHTQKPYLQDQAYRIEKAPRFFDSILNIPCSVGLTDEQVDRVVGVLREGRGRS